MTQLAENKKDISTTVDVENKQVVFEFGNGKYLYVEYGRLSADLQLMAALHGLKQKCGDAGAISRNPDTGKSATIDDKYNAVKEVVNRLKIEGQWNKTRDGGSPKYGLLLTALIRLYPDKTTDQLKTFIDKKDKSEQAALRLNPKISSIIEQIKLERMGDVNVDSLLDELDD